MNRPNLKDFTFIENKYGLNQKYWSGDVEVEDGSFIPLDMTLTEYAGDRDSDVYFTVDFKQGKLYHGDEFETAEEALEDAFIQIEDLYQGEYLNTSEYGEDDYQELG